MGIASWGGRGRTLVAAGVLVLAVPGYARAADAQPPAEQVWLISTRELAGDCSETRGEPKYWLWGADRRWVPSDQKAFLAADRPAMPTIFHVHGNRTNLQDAVDEAWDVLGCLKEHARARPFRLAIWAWYADRIPGRLRVDVRTKAARSDRESYRLARLIDAMHPDIPVTLTGYSFGARTIGGVLSLLAGQPWAGQVLPPRDGKSRITVRAVLVAAGADDTMLLPGGPCPGALCRVERVLVTANARDTALRWYRHIDRRNGPDALGLRGPACLDSVGPDRDRVEVLDLTCDVGRNHTWAGYVGASTLRLKLSEYAIHDRPPAGASGGGTAPAAVAGLAGADPASPRASGPDAEHLP
jgi:hypothetical protein